LLQARQPSPESGRARDAKRLLNLKHLLAHGVARKLMTAEGGAKLTTPENLEFFWKQRTSCLHPHTMHQWRHEQQQSHEPALTECRRQMIT
jgi:hypothetical protein